MNRRKTASVLVNLSIAFFVVAVLLDLFAIGPFTIFLDVLKFAPASFLVCIASILLLVGATLERRPIPFLQSWKLSLVMFLGLWVALVPASLYRPGYDRIYLASVGLECIVVMLYVSILGRLKEGFIKIIVSVLVASLGMLSIIGILEQFGLILWRWNGRFQQVATLFANASLYAGVLLLLVPFSAYIALVAGKKWVRILCAVCFFLGYGNLLLAQSRAAILAFIASLALCGVIYVLDLGKASAKHVRLLVLTGAGLLALFFLGLGILPLLRHKFGAFLDVSGITRLNAYRLAISLWLKSPRTWFFGNGLGSFPEMFFSSKPPFYRASLSTDSWDAVHDEALDRLVDGGILGLAAYVGLIAILLSNCLKTFRNKNLDRHSRLLGLACLFAIVGSVLDSLLSTNSRVSFIEFLFAIVAGLSTSAFAFAQRTPNMRYAPFRNVILPVVLVLCAAVVSIPQGQRLLAEHYMTRSVKQNLSYAGKSRELGKARLADPRDIYPDYLQARAALDSGEFSECMAAAVKAQAKVSNFRDTELCMAIAENGLHNAALARIHFDQYLLRDQYDASAEENAISTDYALGDKTAAVLRLEEWIQGDFAMSEKFRDFKVSFPESDVAKREGRTLILGKMALMGILDKIFSSPTTYAEVFFYRLDLVVGNLYEQAGIYELAVARYRAAEEEFPKVDPERNGARASQSIAGWPSYAVDSDLRKKMIERELPILEALAQNAAAHGKDADEIDALREYLHLSRDQIKQERLAFLLSKDWRFKERRLLSYAASPNTQL
jgi:O-antigen ligase